MIERLFLFLGLEPTSESFRVGAVVLSVAVIMLAGFLVTRLTKLLRLPNVTAYIVAGILIGPYVFRFVPASVISGMDFLSDIALAFIAFSAGEFFELRELKKAGSKVIFITLLESVGAFVLVLFVTASLLHIDLSFSLVLAALSSATAPASTLMTIRQTKAGGVYVNTLLEVVALDDVVALVLYSVAISVCIALNGEGTFSVATAVLPLLKNLLCLGLGFVFGFLLRILIPEKRTTDNRLIIVIAVLFSFVGVCLLFGESPLLGCMAIGMVYTNTMPKGDMLFKQLNYFAPPILLLFFVRSGMSFDLSAFTSSASIGGVPLLAVAVIYFFVRILGKYAGAFFGALITKSPASVRNYLGLALIPQAGVAIGLAAMGARTFMDAGQPTLGASLNTIILASSVLYEMVGPACAKLGLYLSHSFEHTIDHAVPVEAENEVEKLILQIKQIQATLPPVSPDDSEASFNAAAEEYEYENYNRSRYRLNQKSMRR